MRKGDVDAMRNLAVPWVALVVFGAAACGGVTQPHERLEVSISISENPVYMGDVARVRVVARNPSASTLRFVGDGCLLTFELLDAIGTFVGPNFVCNSFAPAIELAAGDSLVAEHSWSDLTFSVKPGAYLLRGVLRTSTGARRSQPLLVDYLVR